MANEIKLKRGSGSDPGASDLVVGEIAIRTDTGKLFTKKDDNSVAEITGGGGISDGDKGDITVSNSGATFTIDSGVISTAKVADDAITFAKIQNVSATNRILGRDSSGAGVIEEITPANLRTMINVEDGATADQTKSDIDALGIAASTAATLATARTIAGVSFDGSGNISLNNNAITNGAGYITATLTNEEVQDIVGGMLTGNTETGITVTYQDGDGTIDFVVGTLNQDTTGNAATATALETARNIGGVSFDGTGNINLPGVNTSGNQDTSGTAAIATTVTVADESSDTSCNVLFATAATGNLAPKSGTNLTFNSSSGVLTATGFAGALTGNVTGNASGSSGSCTGNAATATSLETARTIAGVSFDGTANISLNNNAITNGAGYITATLTNEQVQDIVGGMVSSNTETGITVTYQDGDGTLDFVVASQTDENFTTTLKNKLDGIASGATNVTNNNQLTNGAGYITSASDSTKLPLSGGELTGDLTTHVVKPDGNNTRTLGTSSARWSDIFTNDLHLSNKGGSNKVDNTWGDFTIQEGIEDLFLINNRNGKMYKFMLKEVG